MSSGEAMVRPSAELAIIHLSGDEITMGRQHGALTRELGGWEDNLSFYADMPRHILGGGRRDRGRQLLVRALAPLLAVGLERLERARPASLRARTDAFLKALGRAPAERRNVFVLDLAQNAIGVLGRWGLVHQAAALAPPGACSSFALWGEASEDGRLLHARNFDLLGIGIWERAPTVVFCTPTRGLRYGFVSTRGADVPGVTAFNEAGLTLSAHTRFHREVTFDGLGVVDLGHMIASRATSLADAVAIAIEQRIASSWGIVVSSAHERRAIVIETHAGRIAVHRPRPGARHLAATNRNRVAVMQRGELAPSEAWVRYSDGREAVLERHLEGARGLGVGDATRLLSSHEAGDVPGWERLTGDCPAQTITIQSAVVDPEREELWVSTGGAPTSKGPWVRVPWRWGGAAECRLVGAAGDARALAAGTSGGREAAYAHLVEAARLEQISADEDAVEAALGRALALAPDDPSLRQLAGGLALRAGRFDDAIEHLEAAMESERSTFRIAELHRWASRAARWAGRSGRAREHRRDLGSRRDQSGSLGRLDGWSARWRHREVAVSFQLLSLG
jgi:hypothetical protein